MPSGWSPHMPEEIRVDFQNIGSFAQLYISVFNAPPWSDGWSIDAVVERLESFARMPRFFGVGLIHEGEPVALALGWGERWVTGWHFHLKEMCVKPDCQGQGVGKTLLASLECALSSQAYERIYLETGIAAPARGFYEASGYSDIHLVSLSRRIKK